MSLMFGLPVVDEPVEPSAAANAALGGKDDISISEACADPIFENESLRFESEFLTPPELT